MSGKQKFEAKDALRQSEKKISIVVGIGASAGGLKALQSFFSQVSEPGDIAYLVVTHISRKLPSMLPELLQRITPLPVQLAADGQVIQPGHIYINPPDREVSLCHGKIQLLDIEDKNSHFPIDRFFKSLAVDQRRKAVAIIFSGTGTDGTNGVREINSYEGLVLVQDEASASYDGMPGSVIRTGLADMILPPEEMQAALERYLLGAPFATGQKHTPDVDRHPDWLDKIFSILRNQVGHDFSVYKSTTTLRRISRRMRLNQVDSYESYVRYLQENKGEVEALFRELLIGVTSFFREPHSFEILKTKFIPRILEQKGNDSFLRAWIPACSTGEEVYSLAIVLNECLAHLSSRVNLQLFGTDINGDSIDIARQGVYPASISENVGEERLNRFFTREGAFYRVRKSIRDCVIFSIQDVLKDPPFSHLDILCCRNLLIYLNTGAQKKLLPLFHYTLKQDGILMLGSSETIGGFRSLFEPVDKRYKVFRKREVHPSMRQFVTFPARPLRTISTHDFPPTSAAQQPNFSEITKLLILKHYAPAAILINDQGEILYVQGRTGKYLESPTGPPTQNIVDLARDGLRIELSSAIRMAKASGQPVSRQGIRIQSSSNTYVVNLHVCPQQSEPTAVTDCLLVFFEDADTIKNDSGVEQIGTNGFPADHERILALEKELQVTRENHRGAIEELESSTEELKSTNEELQSANEELQSTNEELESSKEELQSLNEEMQTVNSELQAKLEELSAANDDMRNLLNSTEIATIFLDNDLRLRRYTEEAIKIIHLIQTDIGRPLEQVVSNLVYEDMIKDLRAVITNLSTIEKEVQTRQGAWYNMRIIPYRAMDNRVSGAVLIFSNIDEQKEVQTVLRESIKERTQSQVLVRIAFDMSRQPLAVLDKAGKIIIANSALARLIEGTQDEVEGAELIEKLKIKVPQKKAIRELAQALVLDKDFKTAAFSIKSKTGDVSYTLKGRAIRQSDEFPDYYLVQLVKRRKATG